MENVLCLIGFSGEDPNFLQWAGWVRDQLGSTAPKMYLCGAFDLTTPERSYYQHMQVIPVDLGPLFPKEHCGSAERHRAALAWLLESLHAGEPVDRSRWPDLTPRARTVPLPVPFRSASSPEPPKRLPEHESAPTEFDDAALKGLLARWRSQRASYPGWVVYPKHFLRWLAHDARKWFWHFDQPAVARLFEALPVTTRVDALREIAWRAEICLVPLPERVRTIAETTLEAINPRPRLIHLPEATLTYDTATERLDWDSLTEVWVELAFALVRHAWQLQEADLYERWMGRLQHVAAVRSGWRARWWYEKCWHHLVHLEFKEALQAARDWPEDASLPFWEAKRAAVLGELGDIVKARATAAQALQRVRLGRDRSRIDYQSLSEEGWIHLLQQVLDGYVWKDVSWSAEEMRERRLRELARDHCNPWDDIRELERSVQEEDPGVRDVTRAFDPGHFYRSFKSAPATENHWALIGALHDGATPPSKRDGFLAALRRVWRSSPRLALGLGIRADASEALKEGEALAGLVGRAAVARMAQANVDRMYDWLSSVLRAALRDRQDHAISDADTRGGDRRIEGVAEVLSRLAFRLGDARLPDLFELACEMYRSPACQQDIALHRPAKNLLTRTLDAATSTLLGSWLPQLLGLPVAGEPGFYVAYDAIWPDPFEELSWQNLPMLTPADAVTCVALLDRLLGFVRGDDLEARKRACNRLLALALSGALTRDQIQSLVGAIRSKGQGYPADIGILPWVLLKLPYGQLDEARHTVVRFLCDGEFDEEHGAQAWVQSLLSTTTHIVERGDTNWAWPRIAWTPEEAGTLLTKLASLWKNAVQDGWLARDPELARHLCEVLSMTIAPFLDPADPQTRVQVRALVDDIRRTSALPACAWPALLLLDCAHPAEAVEHLHRALLGSSRRSVHDAAFALPIWIDLGQARRIGPPPTWLVDTLVACAETGRQPGLTHVLDAATALLQRKEPVLEDRHLDALTRAVDRLRETMALEGMREDGTWDDDLQLDADERMAVLAEASALAAALAALYRRRSAAEPDAVALWRALAATHPLPEVRHPWRAYSHTSSDAGLVNSPND